MRAQNTLKHLFMPIDNNKDAWDMEVSFDDEVRHSFKGKTPRTISQVLLGTKQWMETKKKELWIIAQGTTAP